MIDSLSAAESYGRLAQGYKLLMYRLLSGSEKLRREIEGGHVDSGFEGEREGNDHETVQGRTRRLCQTSQSTQEWFRGRLITSERVDTCWLRFLHRFSSLGSFFPLD